MQTCSLLSKSAADYRFTNALTVQLLKSLMPALALLLKNNGNAELPGTEQTVRALDRTMARPLNNVNSSPGF